MSKLTPTAIILIIAGIGLATLLYFRFQKKKKGDTVDANIPLETDTTQAQEKNRNQPIIQSSPVGLIVR